MEEEQRILREKQVKLQEQDVERARKLEEERLKLEVINNTYKWDLVWTHNRIILISFHIQDEKRKLEENEGKLKQDAEKQKQEEGNDIPSTIVQLHLSRIID